ncbi:MAG: porin [Cyanobacteria bacterium K_DeepCast_35m_m2_023]|nr:porin [Cyanobacteria bacterium K_DeepCast_35m_m2_023]
MKLFQQLLVAPAALGLLAPVAANAAEFNLDGVNKYASEEQVTSISQLSDVKPTDWAYQALSNLIERYGCVAGYPGGTYKGQRAMTRFEAAALLNACLDRVSEVTDELKKLMAEFEKELAVLKGRVDGLEAKVGVLEAQQFSTTTKLKGIATMVLGGVAYGSNNYAVASAGYNTPRGSIPAAVSFNYDIRLNFDTSFTGKDLLRTTLRAGNPGAAAFDFNNPVTTATSLYDFFQDPNFGPGTGGAANNIVGINRLFYQFPVGSGFTATFGARVRQDEMLAMWPSAYPSESILDLFSYAGSPLTYALNLGGGMGLWWQKDGFSISFNYVSQNAGNGNPNAASLTSPGAGGIGNALSSSSSTLQIGYASENWGAALAYAYNQNISRYNCTNTCFAASRDLSALGNLNSTNSLALSGYWQPTASGWLPSVSAGWGISTTQFVTRTGGYTGIGATVNSWSVGLQWSDVFAKGNQLGMAFGQAPMISKWMNAAVIPGVPDNGNWAWEWWYKFQVTDNISVAPGLFYLSRPLGGFTPAVSVDGSSPGYFNSFGYLLKTTFTF